MGRDVPEMFSRGKGLDGASPPVIVVAGVSGSGKSMIGAALARRLGMPFQEGDDLHPAANIARMRAGVPLTDADRAPWLDRVADWIGKCVAARTGGVISCSALKRAYRDRLRAAGGEALRIVLLDPPRAVLERRLAARRDHFMPAGLLDSQLATLERPRCGEGVLRLDGAEPIDRQCDAVVRDCGLG